MIEKHEPVLLREVIESLCIKKGNKYIDATLGGGGYTKAICEAGGKVLGIDADSAMIKIARQNLEGKDVKMVNGNFRDIKKIAEENGFMNVDGIVFDLGVSNVHFGDMERGFSFKNPNAKLDMRLDPSTQSVTASDLLNMLREDQLKEMFGANLAKKIVEFRRTKKFETVGDFVSLFELKKARISPMTVPFMNLRIAVNSELENLEAALPQSYELLALGGRLAVVSFHSGEDEIVKRFMKEHGESNDFVRPGGDEVRRNPKSRSAILRSVIKK